MAWQLIYTSAPRLLTAGQTGFGTVARHKAVPPLVVSAVERASQFARLPGMDAERVVYCHRIVVAGGTRYHVLSRTASAGADYTGRTNHLAHHVILTAAEAAQLGTLGVSAADVLLRFPWRSSWSDAPRWLEEDGEPRLEVLPAKSEEASSAWAELGGSAARAGLLVTEPGARGSLLVVPPRVDLRRVYAESVRLVSGSGWQYTFTTELDPGEDPGDFRWLGLPAESALLAGLLPGRRLLLDFTKPDTLPNVDAALPVPEKPKAPAAAVSAPRQAPPKMAAPGGGGFQEPLSAQPPPPLIAQQQAQPAAPRPTVERQLSQSKGGHRRRPPEGSGGKVLLVVAALVVVTLIARSVWMGGAPPTSPLGTEMVQQSPGRTPVPMPEQPGVKTAPEATPGEPGKPMAAATPSAPASQASPPQAPAPVVPLRVVPVSKLAALELTELRTGQVHLLITSSGAERGPLNEVRNGLWASLKDKSPALKLDYASRRAEWTAPEDSEIVPPVQWRVLQDGKEVLRVLIGDHGNQRPMNAAAVSAKQDGGGAIGGEFALLLGRLGTQAVWLRLPAAVGSLLKESGYGGPAIAPVRDMKADTSDLISWVVKEQTLVSKMAGSPTASLGPDFPAPVKGEFKDTTAPMSSRANTLGNRPAPTSSVAGNEEAKREELRLAAQDRLVKLTALREHPVLQGKLSGATFSLFAGPAGSSPADAVWVCDVAFSPETPTPSSPRAASP